MAHPVIMPKAGQSMTEGKIVAWLKKEGEPVKRGDPILEIETDKANLEVEAQEPGVLRKVFYPEGHTCPVLTVIGVIGGAAEAIDFEQIQKSVPPPEEAQEPAGPPPAPAAAPQAAPPVAALPAAPAAAARPVAPATAPPKPVAMPIPAAASGDGDRTAPAAAGRVFASPLARRIAKERGIDVARLRGSGPGGRILRRDVESAPVSSPAAKPAFLEALPTLAPPKPYPPPSPRPPARLAVEGMRKAIGTALQYSKQNIPHFYAGISVDATAALALKKAKEAAGIKVSINDIIVRACAIALQDEPRVNCRVFPDHIEYPADVNIGIAVGTEEGLVVPVVTKAQTRDLAGIAAEARRVIDAANAGKLIGTGTGTFTVSNLGMFGVETFTAIINPPEGAILAVGTVKAEVVPMAGGFLPRSVMALNFSCDHRAIDGVVAARFLARIKHLLENPDKL